MGQVFGRLTVRAYYYDQRAKRAKSLQRIAA